MILALRTRPEVYQRYWARAYAGWPRFQSAVPGAAHHALARLESQGRMSQVVTQNVDRLHQQAGSRDVIDLHGRLDVVACLGCGARTSRLALQTSMRDANAGWTTTWSPAPDGDADIPDEAVDRFIAPRCDRCDGLLKPDVVFFGENVPPQVYASARDAVARAQALLVVGSSLMVYSGYRFVLQAREAGLPIAIVNRGRTRGDAYAALKLEGDAGEALEQAASRD